MFGELYSVSSSGSLDSTLPGSQEREVRMADADGQSQVRRANLPLGSLSRSSSGTSALHDVSANNMHFLQLLPAWQPLKENQQPSLLQHNMQTRPTLQSDNKLGGDADVKAQDVARWAMQDSAHAALDVALATERALQELELELQLHGAENRMVRSTVYLLHSPPPCLVPV